MKSTWCIFILLFFVSCSTHNVEKKKKNAPNLKVEKVTSPPVCTDEKCSGRYEGVEFNSSEKSDIAHQYSNIMSTAVGNQLKKLYKEGNYSKVDFDHIVMTTKGMNDGDNYVVYELEIPFVRVRKEEAMTAFDHSGGWNHYPAITERKKVLLESDRSTVVDSKLDVSELKKTKEGLQEFWIQWKHKDFQ